jgi:acetyl esterase
MLPMANEAAKLDADCKALLEFLTETGAPTFETMTPEHARQFAAQRRADAKLPAPTVGSIENRQDAPLPLRIYRPLLETTPAPALIFFHGGGWVIGDLESHDHLCRSLCRNASISVISVDYPLAPESKFPRAIDACVDTLLWIFENAKHMGLDPNRLALGGDSAGGNLAAVLALIARDQGPFQPKAQVLFYPATDLTMAQASYGLDFAGMPVSAKTMDWFISQYLETSEQALDWRASPLRADRFDGVAPAFIMTAGCDVLCDEGQAYADALRAAGVAVTLQHFPGQIHPFLTLPHVLPRSYMAIEAASEFLVSRLLLDAQPGD